MNKYLKKLLPFYQKLGVSLVPNRYEEPIPDLAELRAFDWEGENPLLGIDLQTRKQIRLLGQISKQYLEEFKRFPAEEPSGSVEQYFHSNPAFKAVDAGVYYGLIRLLKPRRIIEIGAGYSTLLAARAAVQNEREKHPCDLTAIEPYPSKTLRGGIPGLKRLLETTLQKVSLEEFGKLQKNDILFIDSSHISKIGSDVNLEILEILPVLRPGVLVHFHDIFIPFDYPRDLIMRDFRFYNEQYLLQAFLAFNKEFEVVWAGQHLYQKHYSLLEKHFGGLLGSAGDARDHWRSVSFWIRRKG